MFFKFTPSQNDDGSTGKVICPLKETVDDNWEALLVPGSQFKSFLNPVSDLSQTLPEERTVFYDYGDPTALLEREEGRV